MLHLNQQRPPHMSQRMYVEIYFVIMNVKFFSFTFKTSYPLTPSQAVKVSPPAGSSPSSSSDSDDVSYDWKPPVENAKLVRKQNLFLFFQSNF